MLRSFSYLQTKKQSYDNDVWKKQTKLFLKGNLYYSKKDEKYSNAS